MWKELNMPNLGYSPSIDLEALRNIMKSLSAYWVFQLIFEPRSS
jgi:hypothetical protein